MLRMVPLPILADGEELEPRALRQVIVIGPRV
jgi:hypothetical protein